MRAVKKAAEDGSPGILIVKGLRYFFPEIVINFFLTFVILIACGFLANRFSV